MSSWTMGKTLRCRLQVEVLEDRVQLDVAPIGPIAVPDNPDPADPAFYNEINESYTRVDVLSLLRVRTAADVARVRQNLIQFIWKGAGFPTARPLEITISTGNPLVADPEFDSPAMPNLQRIERMVMPMGNGVQSTVYLFHPSASSNRLAIWQQGHDHGLGATGGYEVVGQFLQRGYTVLAAWLPFYGESALERALQIGNCRLNLGPDHDELACLETPTFTPIRYFVESLALALNHTLALGNYRDVTMVGLSGGGWLTSLYAALDPRVRVSIPVAGSLPSYLRTSPYIADMGDWEQHGSGLYRVASYLDLYMLGSHGPGRKVLQVFNKYDDCCFAGVRYRTYLDHVKDAVARLGAGSFDVFLDDSVRQRDGVPIHQVAAYALQTAIAHAAGDSPAQFVDDGDNTYWNGGGTSRSSFRTTGAWTEVEGIGFGRDFRTARKGQQPTSATWQFQVVPGRYQVAVTWNAGVTDAAGAAPFVIYDGAIEVARITVDQRLAPDGFYESGAAWKVLGEFTLRSTRLQVVLTDPASGTVIADGVRIESTNHRGFVRQLYRDLLQREPDPVGLDSFTNLLNDGRYNRSEVARGFLSSREYREVLVQGLYRDLLRREADAAGLAVFVEFLGAGGSAAQLKAVLLASPEYFQGRGNGTNAGFLEALFGDVLRRPTDAVGREAFQRLLAGGTSRGAVALQVASSAEARRRDVASYYTRFLERTPDGAGLNAFAQAMGQGMTEEQVISAFLGSEEYLRRSRRG